MAKDYEKMSLFEQIKAGLEDSIGYSRGQLTLKTTELPEPPPRMRATAVARLRKRFKMSQAVFAAVLNVSPKTVQSWEQGEREPSDVALRMLQVLGQSPDLIGMVFGDKAGGNGARSAKNGVLGRYVCRGKRAGSAGCATFRLKGIRRSAKAARRDKCEHQTRT